MVYLQLILRTVISYLFLFILMILMGKREIGQLSLFDFIITLSIADIMVIGIQDLNISIFYSFVPMLLVSLLQIILSKLCLKYTHLRTFVDGKESFVILDGKINLKEMKKQRYNLDDLYHQLHEQGIKGISEVEYAILESNGKLAVFKNNKDQVVSFPLIISGEFNDPILGFYQLNKEEILKTLNVQLKDIHACEMVDRKIRIVPTLY